MTVLQSIPFTCEECGGRFDPLGGGICRACGRLLCARHFALRERGWWWPLFDRREPATDARPVCRACRRGGAQPRGAG